ncbi:MAG TPA: MMPL family transporter [Pirellulales bacterium]|jgi:hypothetical protein|nr:MMPL family transporter [Pirellulales bacterium]
MSQQFPPTPDLDGVSDPSPDVAVAVQPDSSAHAPQQSWLTAGLLAITRLVLRFPKPTLAVAVALAIVSVIYSIGHLGYKSSRLDLLNPKSDYNRLWIEYVNEFGDEDDAVIVVEGAGREQVVPVVEEISTALEREKRLFHAILDEWDLTKVRPKALHLVPPEQLQGIDRYVEQKASVACGDWSQLQVGKLLGNLTQQLQAASAGVAGIDLKMTMYQIDATLSGLVAQFRGEAYRAAAPPDMPIAMSMLSQLGPNYLLAKDGQMGFVLLRLVVNKEEFARGSEAVDALREIIAEIKTRHPNVRIGLTGLPVMENDEMRESQSSMLWGSLLSFVGVVIIVIAGFGGLRHALLANLVLLLGTAWAFGYVTLTVGHLNILSVTFTATLIGIGIDYGAYYVSRYMQLMREGLACEEALLETTRAAGPAIVTGALITSIAFFSAALTSFTGVAELGIIAGGGLLLCAVAQLFVLPPLIKVVDGSQLGLKFPTPVPVHKWINPLLRFPRLVFCAGLLITATAGWGVQKLWYDHNLLDMQAKDLESVKLERRLLVECDKSAWYALSISDSREELLKREAKFKQLPSVDRTEEIARFLPDDEKCKQPIIIKMAQRLASLPERPPLIGLDSLDDLGAVLANLEEVMRRTPNAAECTRHLEWLRDSMRRLSTSDCYARLSQFQQQMAGDLLTSLYFMRSMANPEPPQLSDLSPSLVSRFVGQNGKYLLKIYGRGDIWNIENLTPFVQQVRSVDPKVTGNPLQAFEASQEMETSYQKAAGYSLIVIFVLLFIDFRNLLHVFLAALPLAMGMVITFGLMGYLNQPLNPANLIALPLLLGMGVDYGVYVVHEFLEQQGRYRMSSATAVGLLVDSLATIIGYAGLLIASHQGLQSLGRSLTIGVAVCTLTSMILLPALLSWMTRKRPLVPWVGSAVVSYDHDQPETDPIEDNTPSLQRAA